MAIDEGCVDMGAFDFGFEKKKNTFCKRMVRVRKMVACLENTDYSSCLKLTVTRGVLGKELGTMN